MGASQSSTERSVVLYYVPWKNEDVWKTFSTIAERMAEKKNAVPFRMVNAFESTDEALAMGVTTFPTLVCHDGTKTLHIKNPDSGFASLMRWVYHT